MAGLVVETHAAVRVLRLDEPESRNALSPAIRAGLETEVPAYFADPALRCLMITGTGGAFCAGGDLEGLAAVPGAPEMQARMERAARWVGQLLAGTKPVLCAVDGPAVGAGLGLAMTGDIVLASEDAVFMAGFSMIGLACDFGLGATLPRAIGMPRARDMLMANRRVDAAEAERIGLVSRCLPVEGFDAAALDLARRIAEGPAFALAQTKRLTNLGAQGDIAALLAAEGAAQAIALTTADFAEGVAAFRGKRRPRFNAGD